MPYDPLTETFTRDLRFVDDRLATQRVTRGDLDAALDDVAGGINSIGTIANDAADAVVLAAADAAQALTDAAEALTDSAQALADASDAKSVTKRIFDTHALLVADNTLTPANTPVGEIIDAREAGNFRALLSGQTVTTAALLKLRPIDGYGGFSILNFGFKVSDPLQDHTDIMLSAFDAGCVINFPPLPVNLETAIDLRAEYGVGIWGSGRNPFGNRGTLFTQHADNVPIFRVLGPVSLRDFAFKYVNPQSEADTESIGIEFQRLAQYDAERLWGINCHITFGQKQAGYGADTFNTSFSGGARHLVSYGASMTHFDFRNFDGGGTNNTFFNLYANGGGLWRFNDVTVPIETTRGIDCHYGMRFLNQSGMAMGEISLDGLRYKKSPYEFGNCSGVISTIRAEVGEVQEDASGIFSLSEGENNLEVGNLIVRSIMAGQVNPLTGAVNSPISAMYFIHANSPKTQLRVKSLEIQKVTIATTGGALGQSLHVGAGVLLGSVVSVDSISMDGLSSGVETTTWSEGKRSHPPIVEKFNKAIVFQQRRAGRGNLLSTVFFRVSGPPLLTDDLPEQGAYAYGDICEYISPGDNGRVASDMWVPPGVWVPISIVGGESDSVTNHITNTDVTLTPRGSRRVLRYMADLAVNATVNLSLTDGWNGCTFEIHRVGAGAGTLTVGAGLYVLTVGQKCFVRIGSSGAYEKAGVLSV